MIKYTKGDILKAQCDALVNPVNCVGLMGRGLALQFKKAWPNNFRMYQSACKVNHLQPGRMFVYDTGRNKYPKFIINFPTKRHWRDCSLMLDIENGLDSLKGEIARNKIKSIAIPAIGCGLGGLNWFDVKRKIRAHLGVLLGVEIIIFEPNDGEMVARKIAK